MEQKRIANFIKTKRKELGITQEELASRLFVTEKAISRWETGRGFPDISLLLPLSKELNVDVSELLNGENNKDEIEELIEYNEIAKTSKHSFLYKLTISFYVLSVLVFLFYLRFEYDPNIEINYFIRLFIMTISSILIVIGNNIYSNNYVEKIEDKKKVLKLSHIIVFIYYLILIFNMTIFARYNIVSGYNLVPFRSICNILKSKSLYNIVVNIFGNPFIFMPFEYFLIELFKIKKIKINLVVSFMIVLLIEVLQYVFKVGIFDVDDLILCTLGMMMFYIIYKSIRKGNYIL